MRMRGQYNTQSTTSSNSPALMYEVPCPLYYQRRPRTIRNDKKKTTGNRKDTEIAR